jgi:hypothetical protein
MIYHFKYEKTTFHQELHLFEIITFDSRIVLVYLQLCNNNETMHFNKIYEELQSSEPKSMRKTHKTEVSGSSKSHLTLVRTPSARNEVVMAPNAQSKRVNALVAFPNV